MSRFHSYLNTATTILSQYKGESPLANWLKDFFSKDKKYGSGDRKWISHLCYCYFRTGHGFENDPMDEKIMKGLFLCSSNPNPLLDALWPECNIRIDLPLMEKLKWLNNPGFPEELFPWQKQLSDGIDPELFSISHLEQPDLFLRIRPGKREQVEDKLRNAGIHYRLVNEEAIALANSTKIDKIISLDEEAVVQDYSSQRIGELMVIPPRREDQVKELVRPSRSDHYQVWDCCAASGGKSILAKDVLGDIELTASDNRTSILSNLKKRFAKAGIQGYRSLVADLSGPVRGITKNHFDLIIADLPCTGSGTWSRTPEELFFFNEEEIEKFSNLQFQIIRNVIPHLKPGGFLLYITCSVFKKENEENIQKLVKEFSLTLLEQKLFAGYEMKADTMFAALLQKP